MFVFSDIFGFRGKPAYAPVCIAAMGVTKADRIQSRKAAVETETEVEEKKSLASSNKAQHQKD